MKSTYIDGMFSHVKDGKLFTHWEQTSAATGRLASTHPNLQSLPRQPLVVSDISHIVGEFCVLLTECTSSDAAKLVLCVVCAAHPGVGLAQLCALGNPPVTFKLSFFGQLGHVGSCIACPKSGFCIDTSY